MNHSNEINEITLKLLQKALKNLIVKKDKYIFLNFYT